MGHFEELLEELGKVFHLKLHVDKHLACSILIPPLIIQLQPDAGQEKLYLFSKIIELPPGKFRENILKDALKANSALDPRAGVLGYIAATNHLTLHQIYPFSILNGERLANFFGAFFEMGESWQKAIASGQSAPTGALPSSKPPPFQIKP